MILSGVVLSRHPRCAVLQNSLAQACLSNLFLLIRFRTLLHCRKTQLFCFHAIPHSLQKTTGVGVFFTLGNSPLACPDSVGATRHSPLTYLESTLSIPRRMRILSEHRESKDLNFHAPIFDAQMQLGVSAVESTVPKVYENKRLYLPLESTLALLTSLAQLGFEGSTRGVLRCFLMEQEGR
jgi:hypothetical protein